jgi:hypothetical protein
MYNTNGAFVNFLESHVSGLLNKKHLTYSLVNESMESHDSIYLLFRGSGLCALGARCKKNLIVRPTSKHMPKVSFISRVLRCRCVWMQLGRGSEIFLTCVRKSSS